MSPRSPWGSLSPEKLKPTFSTQSHCMRESPLLSLQVAFSVMNIPQLPRTSPESESVSARGMMKNASRRHREDLRQSLACTYEVFMGIFAAATSFSQHPHRTGRHN